MWVIMTDRFTGAGSITDASGQLPTTVHVEWGNGLRGFVTDAEDVIVFTFDDTKHFASREEAEGVAVVLCAKFPILIGHVMVLPEEDARVIHARELSEWIVTEREIKKGILEKGF